MTAFLNPLDSAFLLLETPGTAMNIGAVIELGEGPPSDADPASLFAIFRDNIAQRLHEIPVLTQRAVRAPLDLTWPILARDEHFDLDRHVVRVAVPSPGTPAQFDALVSEFFSRPLSPHRPLWQLIVVEGLATGRLSLVLKIHHSLADGVSGAETFANLFDISPEVRPPTPNTSTLDGPAATTSLALAREAFARIRENPRRLLEAVVAWGGRLYEIFRATAAVAAAHTRHRREGGQPTIFEARSTSLNGTAGVDKVYQRAQVSLADVKRAAKHRGASVTDVVLTATGGALRRLLEERGESVERDLVAFVPINVRGDGATADLGNQISGMLASLHVDLVDAEERIRAISRDASVTVDEQRRRRAKIFQDVPRVLGPTVISFGGRLISLFDPFRLLPMANGMISSVPGPPVPLWLSGHPVVSASPVGPLFGPFALNVTALGFEKFLEFGLFADAEVVPEVRALRDYLVAEVEDLVAATPT